MFKNHIYFTENPNGKLFNERFNHISKEPDGLSIGNEYEIFLQETYIGKARLIALRDFQYQHLSDLLSYITDGQPLHIYSARIKASDEAVDWNTRMWHMVLEWSYRDLNNQAVFIQQWWSEVWAQTNFIHGSRNTVQSTTASQV